MPQHDNPGDPFARYSEKPVPLRPFDPAALETCAAYRRRLLDLLGPRARIELRGSTALGLPGKGELDIAVVAADREEFARYRALLMTAYGAPGSDEAEFARFNDEADGREIEIMVKLAGSAGERAEAAIQERLRFDPDARRRYLELKERYSYSRREYYRQKDRFFQELLADSLISSVKEDIMRFGEGPRITDGEFFGALDLTRPGLEAVQAAAQRADWPAAQEAFAAYVRQRSEPVWFFDWRARPQTPLPGYDTTEADRIVRNILTSVSVEHDYGPEGNIDWELNPIDYKEWTWQLSRHPFWPKLGEAYWATGDEAYAQAFVRQMMHWVKHVPRPDDSGNPWREDRTNCWRTIECGIRMSWTWFQAFYRFLSSPSFTPEAITTMVKSMVEHARHLMQWPQGGNWLTMESNGLYHVGIMWPEFREAATWRDTAMARLHRELDVQVYPDGAQVELSSGYHQVSLRNFVGAWRIGNLNHADIPADYIAKLERMYHYDLYMAMPDGRMPALNDGNYTDIKPYMEEGWRFFPHRTDFQWAATGGQAGTRPTVNSLEFPYAGHLIMRSGWDRDDRYLFLDAGPFGYGHQHEDKLNIVLYAYGKVLIADPGNYPYDSSEWRKYVLSTRGHNTIRVDGNDQHERGKPRSAYVVSEPLPHTWISADAYDYAAASYEDGYGPQFSAEPADQAVAHHRKILFVKPDFWLMADFLTSADEAEHVAESLLHLDVPKAAVTATGIQTHDACGPNLVVRVAASEPLHKQIVSGQTEPVVQGWIPRGGPYEVQPIPTAVLTAKWKRTMALAYVLWPQPPGAPDPIKSFEQVAVQADDPAIGLRLATKDGRTFIYAQRHGQHGLMRWEAFESDAEAALVELHDTQVVRVIAADGQFVRRVE